MKTTHFITTGLALLLAMTLPMTSYGQSNDYTSATVNEGVEAYQKGDYKRAYDIWSYHANIYPWGGTDSLREKVDQARTNLGALYYLGKGTYQSHFMAAYWHDKSATNSHHAGQNNMGEMHEKGLGVFKDPYKALELYEKSAKQGNPDGARNLKRLQAEMQGKAKRVPKFTWEPKTTKKVGQTSVAYADQTKQAIVAYNLDQDDFENSIKKTYVYFLDLSSIKDGKINGKTYKSAIFHRQYLRTQKFAVLNAFDTASTYKSQRSIEIIDCETSALATWTYQIFENDEQTGKVHNYSLTKPKDLEMKTSKSGTVGLAMVQAVCAGKYMYKPQ